MAANSKIEWCDHTFNPWTGCTKVSPGCANCYAESWAKRSGLVTWGKGNPRRRTSAANWKELLKWNKQAKDFIECSACGYRGLPDVSNGPLMALTGCPSCDATEGNLRPARPRIFCASLADWLDDEVPVEWLSDLIYLICKCNHLDWLLLTKRPQLWRSRLEAVSNQSDLGAIICRQWLDGNPPPNVWIGTTVEDQKRADERIPELIKIPTRVRFLSCEPLLEEVRIHVPSYQDWDGIPPQGPKVFPKGSIHWVICGGESGPGARAMHPAWAQSLRDQCAAAGVAFLFKQWGEWCPRGPESLGYPVIEGVPQFRMTDTGEDGHRAEAGGDNQVWMNRAGKKAAGRLLDGKEWNQFPSHELSLQIGNP